MAIPVKLLEEAYQRRRYKFQETKHNFYQTNANFVVPYVKHSPFRGYRIGDMALGVADLLVRNASAYMSLFRLLRLVNVRSDYTNRSTGSMEVGVSGDAADSYVSLTFAISDPDSFPIEDVQTRILSNRVRVFGTVRDPVRFITVGFRSTEIASYGITSLEPRSLRYLFYTLGAVLRSVFYRLNNASSRLDKSSIGDFYEREFGVHTLQRPLPNVFNLRYEYWVKQKSVWDNCPNLIASRCIVPQTAAIILDFLPRLNLDWASAGDGLVWDGEPRPGTESVFTLLRGSMLRFISAVNDGDTTVPDVEGLLFPGLLFSLIFDGRVGYSPTISADYSALVEAYNERGYDLSALFQPYDLVIRQLMDGSRHTVAKLANALDIFEPEA